MKYMSDILCLLPKTKHSYAISTVHSANRPKLSRAVLIAQKLVQLCYSSKKKHSCAISTVHSANRLKLSTVVLIAQTLAQVGPKISTNAYPVCVQRPKISTAQTKK